MSKAKRTKIFFTIFFLMIKLRNSVLSNRGAITLTEASIRDGIPRYH